MSTRTLRVCDLCEREVHTAKHAFGVDACESCLALHPSTVKLWAAFEKKAKPLELCRGCMTLSFDDQLHTCPRGQR